MSDMEDTKQCTNCKLEILSNNYTIHSAHCQRNFYLCSQCEQPVNFNSKVEHDKVNHAVVCCTDCQVELEKYLLDDHLMNDCPDRKIKCQICDIEVKAIDITEHENYCGSRTEKCGECGEFVMLKYKALHIDSNHTFIKLSDEPGPSPSWQFGKRTLCNFIPDMKTKAYKPAVIYKRKSHDSLRKPRNPGLDKSKNDFDEVKEKNFDFLVTEKEDYKDSKVWNVCDNKDTKKTTKREVDEWPALFSLRSLQISDSKIDKTIPSSSSSHSSTPSNFIQNELDEETDLMYAIQVSQEINSDIWRKEISKEDEALKNSFEPLVESELSSEKFVEKNMFEKNPKKINEESKVDILKNDCNYFYDKHESVKLPCEFCGNLIVSNNLFLHQMKCSLYMTDSYNERRDMNKVLPFDDDMGKKIACGLCNKFYKLSFLENHQLHCQRNRTKSIKNQDKVNYSKNIRAMNMKSEQGLQNGLESSSPQVTRMGTRSEWLSELSKSNEAGREIQNNLNHPESGVITKTTKVSRKNRRAPSPPRR